MIILDISRSEAYEPDTVFRVLGMGEQRRRDYEQLPEDLRRKFEERFKVEWQII